ncbi:MAG: hypothetical protein JEY91_04095 [Spirochaetaceae bacterium]|nr:hypothetical protein [Spirochaetaceae bacterium]
MKKKLLLIYFIFSISVSLMSENVNGIFQGTLSLAQENTVSLALEEVASIIFDKETSFLEGIEIKIEVPRELQKYRNSFALYVYKNISPQPSESVRFYNGSRIFMRLLPVQNNIYIRIPAFEENSMIQSADSILIPGFTSRGDYPLMATIIPIMKGIPGEIYNHTFNFTCRPIYSPKGSLSLNISSNLNDDEETFTVSIDDEPVKWPYDDYILDEGLHEVLITSSTGMNKNASVVINAGEKKNIDLLFEYSEPEIKIDAPEGTLIFLDDSELIRKNPDEFIMIGAGDHIVIFDIGGYQFSREFTVEPGDSLTISLVLDVLIHKN